MTSWTWWIGFLGGSCAGLVLFARHCLVRAADSPVVLRGRSLRRRPPSLRLLRPGRRRTFRLPLLEAAHRLSLPLTTRTLVPYAYCGDGIPLSFTARGRFVLSDDPQVLAQGLRNLVGAHLDYVRVSLEAEIDRVARLVAGATPSLALGRQRGRAAAAMAVLLRPELQRWGLVVAELELDAPTCRPLPAEPSSPARAWPWRPRRGVSPKTPGVSEEDVMSPKSQSQVRRPIHA